MRRREATVDSGDGRGAALLSPMVASSSAPAPAQAEAQAKFNVEAKAKQKEEDAESDPMEDASRMLQMTTAKITKARRPLSGRLNHAYNRHVSHDGTCSHTMTDMTATHRD